MPTYIAFGDWTDQGARAIRESPQRLDAAKRQLEEMGGRFVGFWMTLGQHDMVLVLAPGLQAVDVHAELAQARGDAAEDGGPLGHPDPHQVHVIFLPDEDGPHPLLGRTPGTSAPRAPLDA